MQKTTARMRSPEGEIREVSAEDLTPLMAAGWHQAELPADPETAASTEEEK